VHPRPDPVGPGQESVWNYPRPPSAEVTPRRVVVEVAGRIVADTVRAIRVCETSHPPVFYVPREDLLGGVLQEAGGGSWCEWKGMATYWDAVVGGTRHPAVAWSYERPTPGYEHLRGALAFYPSKLDLATVDGEPVRAQAGDFYGGTLTSAGLGGGRLEVTPQISFEPSVSFNWFDLAGNSYDQHVFVGRLTYTLSPRAYVSGLAQFNSGSSTVSGNFRFRWEWAPGSELFLVYTEDRDTDVTDRWSDLMNRGLVIKINRLFRI